MRINEVYMPNGSAANGMNHNNLVLIREITDGYAYLSKVDEQNSTEGCVLFDSQASYRIPVAGFKKRYALCGRTRAAYRGSASSCRYVMRNANTKRGWEQLIQADREWYAAMRQALSWYGKDTMIAKKAQEYANELDDRINENCKRINIDREQLDDEALSSALWDYDEEGVKP